MSPASPSPFDLHFQMSSQKTMFGGFTNSRFYLGSEQNNNPREIINAWLKLYVASCNFYEESLGIIWKQMVHTPVIQQIYSERRYYMLLTSRFLERSLVDILWESLLASLKPWTLSIRFYLFKREICGHMRIFLLFLYTAEQKVIWSNEKETISIKCNLDGDILSFGIDFGSLILKIFNFWILSFSTEINRKWVISFVSVLWRVEIFKALKTKMA